MLRAQLEDPAQVLALVLLGALVCRAIWLWLPQGALIFDEKYYVNAARVILGWHVAAGDPYAGSIAGLDPNTEHPPLGKVLIAMSMAVFGDNGIGWRIPSVLAGMAALAALYGIVRAAGETAWLGILAVVLLALDNLSLVHGRIGTLDMLSLAPLLVGAWLALRERWALAGAAIAVGCLVKVTGIWALLAVLLFEGLLIAGRWWRERHAALGDLRPVILLVSAWATVAIAGLWLLDLRFSGYGDPWAHLLHMLGYGASLQTQGAPTGIASNPWQWLVNEVQATYLRTNVDTKVNGTLVSTATLVDFRGAMNPAIIGLVGLAIPFAVWLAWRSGNRLALWSATWFAGNYLPYYELALVNHRIMYLYYFLPVVPALAVAIALLLLRSGLPRLLSWAYVAAVGWGFLAYFPFRQIP